MSGRRRYCPRCRRPIPEGESRCLYCGGSRGSSIHISGGSGGRSPHGARFATGPLEKNHLTTILIVVLFGALIFLLIRSYAPLLTTKIHGAGNTGTVAQEKAEEAPAAETGDLAEDPDAPLDRSTIEISGLDDPGSGLHSNLGYSTLIKPIEKGMTPSQVEAAWGMPMRIERPELDEKSLERWTVEELEKKDAEPLKGGKVERWVYGDPLYGVYITGRYVDFRNSRVIDYHIDQELEKLYVKAMEARMARTQ